ncbi:MAG: hypothetical protein LBI45_03660 [Bacteroidales bacterium]|jgi:hypothetical protein|nr:hypothetical protein [Bacteroidales bacterium]
MSPKNKSIKTEKNLRLLNLIGVIATLLALAGTIAALIYASKHLEDIERVAKQLPTKTIPTFPYNMGYINEILKEANENKVDEVVIFTDVTAYGFFSRPKEWYEYRKNIKSIIDRNENNVKTKVNMICYDKALAMNFIKWQLEEYENNTKKCDSLLKVTKGKWNFLPDDLKSDGLYPLKKKDILDKFEKVKSFQELIGFIDWFLSFDYENFRNLNKHEDNFTFEEIQTPSYFYMWQVGSQSAYNHSAIISFPMHKDTAAKKNESCFSTKDTDLLNVFADLRSSIKGKKLFRQCD